MSFIQRRSKNLSFIRYVEAPASSFQAAWALIDDEVIYKRMKKNVASQVIGVQMITASDGSAFTGSVSCYVTGDGGTQGAGGGSVTHEGNGFHTYTPTQAETNYDHIGFTFTGTGAIPRTIQVYTDFPQTGDNYARLGAPAGASVSADIAAIKSDTGAIKTKTDYLPSATAGASGGVFIAGANAATSITTALTANITGNLSGSVGSVTGSVGSVAAGGITAASIATDAIDADALAADAIAEINATVDTALSDIGLQYILNTALPTNWATNVTANSALDYLADDGTAVYDRTTDSLQAIADSGGGGPTAAQIADAVWDETLSGHLGAGSTGEALNAAGAAGDPWTTALPGAYGAGSAGYIIGNNINAPLDTIDTNVDSILADTADMQPKLGTPAGASMSADIAAVKAETAAIVDDTGTSGVIVATNNDKTGYALTAAYDASKTASQAGDSMALTTAAVDAIWDEATAGHVTAGSFGVAVTDTLADTADMQPKLGSPAGASISADIATIDANVDAILVDTGTTLDAALAVVDANVDAILADTGTDGVVLATGAISSTTFSAGAIDAAAIATDAGQEIADAFLLRKLDRSGTGTDAAQERTVVNALRAIRNKVAVSGGTATIYKEDDTTSAWTSAIGTTAGDPISSSDPT